MLVTFSAIALLVPIAHGDTGHTAEILGRLKDCNKSRAAIRELQPADLRDPQTLPGIIESFRCETLIRRPWPPAGPTPTSQLLVASGQRAVPRLIESLVSPNRDVRRNVAYVLGRTRAPEAAPALRDALAKELRRVTAIDKPDEADIAVLDAIAVATALLVGKKVIAQLLNESRAGDSQCKAVTVRVISNLADPKVDCGTLSLNQCYARLSVWWEKNRTKPDAAVLRLSNFRY
jgi:hypothetical protein